MEVRNCSRCGKIFLATLGWRVCPDCVEADRALFESVKEYLRAHPKASMIQVCQATGVPASRIREYVKEGRLVPASDDWHVPCERCGKPVERGRFCPACAIELEMELSSGGPAPAPRDRRHMKVHWDRFRRR